MDLDTFPIKPFDDKLINRVCFMNNIDEYLIDTNFFGGEKEYLKKFSSCNDCYEKADKANFMHNREYFFGKEKFMQLREKYFAKTLKYGERFMHPSISYIDHYYDGSWLGYNSEENEFNKLIREFVESK